MDITALSAQISYNNSAGTR